MRTTNKHKLSSSASLEEPGNYFFKCKPHEIVPSCSSLSRFLHSYVDVLCRGSAIVAVVFPSGRDWDQGNGQQFEQLWEPRRCHSVSATPPRADTSFCSLVQEPLLTQVQDQTWRLSAPSSCLGGEAQPWLPATLCFASEYGIIQQNQIRDSVSYDKSLLLLPILLMPLSYLRAALLTSLWVISLSDASVKKLLQAVCASLEAFPHIFVFYTSLQ